MKQFKHNFLIYYSKYKFSLRTLIFVQQRRSLNKFLDFFRMGTFIDTLMKF